MTSRAVVHLADAGDVLKYVEPGSIDSIVTDPPAGIKLMGKKWDGNRGGRDKWIAWLAGIMRGGLAALRPGGYALVWALPRTSHWTATGVEDAGFEIIDVHHHLFGTGKPANKARLKPGAEHWILARKPGPIRGLAIDACRLETVPRTTHAGGVNRLGAMPHHRHEARQSTPAGYASTGAVGRWPANVSLSEGAAAELDEQSGPRDSHGNGNSVVRSGMGYGSTAKGNTGTLIRDTGGASRFFYVAKAAPSDRTCDGEVDNDHPTVKSRALMRWLVRLVTPPGGLVLDLFAGSGSTALACIDEGMRFVGFENDDQPGAHAIAVARIATALSDMPLFAGVA